MEFKNPNLFKSMTEEEYGKMFSKAYMDNVNKQVIKQLTELTNYGEIKNKQDNFMFDTQKECNSTCDSCSCEK